MNFRKHSTGFPSTFAFVMFLLMALVCFGCVQPVAVVPDADNDNNNNDIGPVMTAVQLVSVTQFGSANLTADTTALILTFDIDPSSLTADNITIAGAEKGALSGTGLTRNIAISNITVASGESVTVSISDPEGYTITGAPKTAQVFRALTIGMHYQGGIIAYILQAGDPGFESAVPHGLIAAEEDQSPGIAWSEALYTNTLIGTGTALGTGASNTDKIIA